MDQLPKRSANYVPLSPVGFLPRANAVYGDRASVIYRRVRFTWRQTYQRCRRLASTLLSLGVRRATSSPCSRPTCRPCTRCTSPCPWPAPCSTPSTRASTPAPSPPSCVTRGQSSSLSTTTTCASPATRSASLAADGTPAVPLVADIDDIDSPTGPASESSMGVTTESVYLWTLPMFHCNGWTFTWGMAARGGVNVCIRDARPADIYRTIARHRVTHMCCAPVVFSILLEGDGATRQLETPCTSSRRRRAAASCAAGARRADRLQGHPRLRPHGGDRGLRSRASGGTSGTASRSRSARASKGAPEVSVLSLADADVKNADTMVSVPRDGKTVGEIVLQGNGVMKGYLNNPEANDNAFRGGWFLTGDVGVVHQDGYIEIKDRSKDVIISGGENICSKEVEEVLFRHPAVADAAVVAMPHPRWGETPCAFVVPRNNAAELSEDDVLAFCEKRMARFMVPKKVEVVGALPRNALGKVEKVKLRQAARKLAPTVPAQKPKGKTTTSSTTVGGRREEQPVAHIMAVSRL
ncbi:unnamed protein product [Miscanthus lutarioriparius]|uniref:Uncharacterized protein n=1 Tax=Miscanthus lutarioriparius TaxID=422564 RepID=A0A811MLN5_9POAL|nr:unnamed protein product [Miscanthus lutarioriparius]